MSSVESDFLFNDEILAGVDFKLQCLGSAELDGCEWTDYDIATVIGEISSLYEEGGCKCELKKARKVLVYVDCQRINIMSKHEDESLLTFRLNQVKDITKCVDDAYSKICVLVAKQDHEVDYKAHLFYCKTIKIATQFFNVVTQAFSVGISLQRRFNGRELDHKDQETCLPFSEMNKDPSETVGVLNHGVSRAEVSETEVNKASDENLRKCDIKEKKERLGTALQDVRQRHTTIVLTDDSGTSSGTKNRFKITKT